MKLQKLTSFFVFSLIFVKSLNAAIEPVNYSKNAILAPCVLALCEKYFKSERDVRGSMVVVNLIPNPSVFQRLVLQQFNEDEDHVLSVLVKDAKKPSIKAKEGAVTAKNYLMLISKLSEVNQTIAQLNQLSSWNPLAEVVVLFTQPMISEKQQLQMSRGVFKELLANSMINVNAIYQYQKNPYEFEVVTWFPFFNNSCADRIENIRKIDECIVSQSFNEKTKEVEQDLTFIDFNREMFPRIPKNFHRCPLKITTFINEPYVTQRYKKIDAGFEIELVKAIAKRLNFKPIVKLISPEKATTLITSNNETGFYADLLQKRADLMIGGLVENAISAKYLSSSLRYFQDDITWCVKIAEKAPMWLNVFRIFNKMTWIGFFITLFVIAIILNVYARHEGKRKDNFMWAFLITLSISTMQYGHYWPQRSSIKLFLAILMIFGLHINTAYRSYLISVLTQPRFEAQIETIQDAFDKNLVFKMDENLAYLLRMKNDSESNQILRNHAICKDITKGFEEMSKNKSIALAVSREHALHNPFGLDEDDIYCFEKTDNVLSYSTVMMFRKFHPLLSLFNQNIRKISESGLLIKWHKDTDNGYLKKQKSDEVSANESVKKESIMKLRLEHIEGAFLIILIGFGIAITAFIFEFITNLLIVKRKKSKKVISKWMKLENYLCHAK